MQIESDIYFEPVSKGVRFFQVPTQLFLNNKKYVDGNCMWRNNDPVYYAQEGRKKYIAGITGKTIIKSLGFRSTRDLMQCFGKFIVNV